MGAMQLALEQLKKKLEKEGLFAPEHKREVPYLPSKIGIVTSLQGAAIKDILKVLERRFKGSELILAHAQVQGESAGREIVQGIEDLNTLNQKLPAKEKIEVLIVGRGGGSIEDLWAFNEEKVARAIYNSRIPVISAVGHERDWTIADLVADMRAPTPSAAAEIVLPEIAELKERVSEVYEDLKRGFESKLQDCFQAADDLRHKLKLLSPTLILEQHARKITELSRSINTALEHFFKLRQLELARAAGNLSNLNPLNILSRGYSATFAQDGTVLRSAAQARPGGRITTRFADGELKSTVTEVIHGRA
jgi:exodeoxyribonuclease VII large subunit